MHACVYKLLKLSLPPTSFTCISYNYQKTDDQHYSIYFWLLQSMQWENLREKWRWIRERNEEYMEMGILWLGNSSEVVKTSAVQRRRYSVRSNKTTCIKRILKMRWESGKTRNIFLKHPFRNSTLNWESSSIFRPNPNIHVTVVLTTTT